MQHDSVGQTLKVATILCIACSVVVSVAAVGLRPRQEANRLREKQKNILVAADVYDAEQPVARQFETKIKPRIVDLQSGKYSDTLEVATYDDVRAASDPELSIALSSDDDIAGLKRRENSAFVYEVYADGELDQIVVPIRGYGLWSTLRGFLAIDVRDLASGPEHLKVRGITYYYHRETPGLGGEVDNQDWKDLWPGKQIYDKDWNVLLKVSKKAGSNAATANYEVDALSGATITSQGVTNMLEFWFGESGFSPFFQELHSRAASAKED